MNFFDRYTQSRNAAIYAMLHAQNGRAVPVNGAAGTSVELTNAKEPIVYDMVWDLIHDENSWNEAYNRDGSPLKKYYEAHPEEDLWNTKDGRAVNFNDRHYEGIIDGEEVSCGTTWATANSQKLSINGEICYCEIWSYGLDSKTVDLFSDPGLTQPLNKTFEITKVSFSEDCKQCWDGTINAPGAKLPWAVVDTKSPYDLAVSKGKIEFQYEGDNVYPYGNEFRNFPKGFGIVSLPAKLGITAIDPKNQEQTDTFDKSALVVKGYVKQ